MTPDVSRREFVQAMLAATLPAHARWRTLSVTEADSLLVAARTMFIHASASHARYLGAVRSIALRCHSEPLTHAAVTTGIRALSPPGAVAFAQASMPERVARLKHQESSDFYALVYTETLDSLYLGGGLGELDG